MNQSYEKKGYLLEDFRLFHLRDVQGAKLDYHYHEFCKILFLVAGTGAYSIEGKRYELREGDIVLVGNHSVHRPEFESGNQYERLILYVSPEFLERQSSSDGDLKECFSGTEGHVLRPNEKTKSILFEQIRLLEESLSDDRYGRTILSNSILLRILVEIVRSLQSGEGKMQDPLKPRSRSVMELITYLDSHLTDELSIESIAKELHLSRFYMMHKFKEEMGTTIHAYVSDRRLLLARDLIANGMTSTEACFVCGFQSYAAFARAYSKFFGVTPTGRKNTISAKEETFE